MKSALIKSFIVIVVTFFYIVAQGQIVYKGLLPDSVISAGHSFNLDLNNDGVNDFIITDSAWSVIFSSMCTGNKTNVNFTVTPLNQNAVLSDSNHHPYAFATNDIITANSSMWSNTAAQSLVEVQYQCRSSRGTCGTANGYCLFPTSGGHWNTASNYLALKLVSGGNTYYGWIRLTMQFGNSPTVAVEEYAFNGVPNMPILAGQKNVFVAVATDSVTPARNQYCSGDSLTIKYAGLGTFSTSNVFTAQLSDSMGSFLHPVSIGTLVSDISGIIHAKIPQNISPGAQYRIRVVASNPYTDSLYGIKSDITIGSGITTGYYPTTFCSGNVAELTAPLGYTYQWFQNGKLITGETGYTYGAWASGNYQCVINGLCNNDTSNTIIVNVYSLPSATVFAAGAGTFCKGGNVTLRDSVDKESTYQWGWSYDGGVPALIAGATKSFYVADSTGAYTVAVTNKNGCTTQSDYILVDAAPSPQDALIQLDAAGDTNFCEGDSLLIGITVNYNDPAPIFFQWTENGTNIPGATLGVHYAKTAGVYTCQITNLCGSTTTNSVSLTTKQCSSPVSPHAVIIAPNPASTNATVTFTLQQKQKTMIRIYDNTGNMIRTLADAEFEGGTNTIMWDGKDSKGSIVVKGLYFIKIETQQDVQTKKIIIVR